MSVRLILNADDFGPIEFINQGVYHHVKAGNLDSAQVLVNMDQTKLKKSLATLHNHVPANKVFELGVHYTLTSGSPMTGGTDKAAVWGLMVEKGSNNSVHFKKYQKFHFGYASYLAVIRSEFEAQRDALLKLVAEVNNEKGSDKLAVTCASNHHNIFTIAPDLFEVYFDVSHEKGLKIRSPKAMPYKVMNQYYEYVLALFNFSDKKKQRHLMAEMNNNFSKNYYTKQKEINVPSPAYVDIEFYKGVGSLGVFRLSKRKVNQRKKAFKKLLHRAQAYKPNTNVEPSPAVVEVVFHLGAHSDATRGMKYKDMVNNYAGVNHKFFDNRETEVAALNDLSNSYSELIKSSVSWNECGIVQFRKRV